jgi:hypothetical protein
MTLDQAVGRVRSAGTSWPPTARPVLAGSAAAWILLAAWAARAGGAPGHPSHTGGRGPEAIVDPWGAAWLLMWLLMVAAMMWPLAVPALTVVRRAAFRTWRVRLVATCLATVTALWVGAGLAVAAAAHLVAVPAGSTAWTLGWVAVAALATRSAWRARVLWRCAKLPAVAPGGLRGLHTAITAGAVAWRRCALLCGPLMAAMVVGHDPVLMVAASVAAWWEAAHPRRWRDPVPMLLLAAGGAWLLLVHVVAVSGAAAQG